MKDSVIILAAATVSVSAVFIIPLIVLNLIFGV